MDDFRLQNFSSTVFVFEKIIELLQPAHEGSSSDRFAGRGFLTPWVHSMPLKVIPKIENLEVFLSPIGQPVFMVANSIVPSSSPDHLPKSDRREDGPRKYQVADFGYVHAGVKHAY